MTTDQYLRFLLQTMRRDATYSMPHHAWVISFLTSKILFLEYLEDLPPEFTSIEEVLAEGVRRGLWDMGIDVDTASNIVVMT